MIKIYINDIGLREVGEIILKEDLSITKDKKHQNSIVMNFLKKMPTETHYTDEGTIVLKSIHENSPVHKFIIHNYPNSMNDVTKAIGCGLGIITPNGGISIYKEKQNAPLWNNDYV